MRILYVGHTSFKKAAFTLLALTSLSACSQAAPDSPILFRGVKSEVVKTDRMSVTPDVPTSKEVQASFVVDRLDANKKDLLEQEFLYGADLQYSSYYDKDMDLYNQSLAIGHIPARFRIVGDELQLVSDNRRLFPSQVNHPEQLISRFKILAQNETQLTLAAGNAGIYLAQVFEGTHALTPGSLSNKAGKPPRDLWVRSFELAQPGNYLLQQTSVVLADGSIAEFMESIFPRTSLAPGESFQKFEMDPENPKGGDSGIFERFRLLAGEHIFVSAPVSEGGEKKVSYAQHYDISKTAANPEGTIDWYATRNIPDEAIEPVRDAVEGWNRYFRKQKGIERDVVLFKGKLPEGIHLGDPRYNVINWDNRLIAGAAYESQATDPETGKQSHSLIYMPAAWLKIGTDYWNNGQFSEVEAKQQSVAPGALSHHGGATSSARLACLKDMRSIGAIAASGRLSPVEVQEFGVRLLKGTLFHEVGHALGLAHNFKGSLTFDRTQEGSAFSTSIMDYNDFEIERAAFPDVKGAQGPELEYDRQFLSAVYNKSADIADGAPILPMCNDEEADAEEDGVDPLCVRYDIEKDPTLSIATAFERVELATKTGDITLAQSLTRVPGIVLTTEAIAKAKTQAEAKALATQVAASLKGSMKFYLTAGKASLGRTVRTNVKSLLVFAEDVLLAGYNERELRERTYAGVRKALALKELPVPVKEAIAAAEVAALDSLAKTPFAESLSAEARTEHLDSLKKSIHKTAMSIETDEASGLPKVRSSILTALSRHKKVDFYFGKLEGADSLLDLESAIVGILGDAITAEPLRTKSERLAAASSLVSFKGRPQGDAALEAVEAALKRSRATAIDNASRSTIESLLEALRPAPKSDED